MSNNPQYIDISHFQPETIDWQAYKKWSSQWDGISRVAMRASYGTGYTDDHFHEYRAQALAAGIDCIIFYHYAYPQFNTATNEANWFKTVVGMVRNEDMIMLDMEEQVLQANSIWAYSFLETIHTTNLAFKAPCLYASTDYIKTRLQDTRLAQFPLILANWTFNPDVIPECPKPWLEYLAFQYTDRAKNIPGLGMVLVDANVFMHGKEVLPVPKPVVPTAKIQLQGLISKLQMDVQILQQNIADLETETNKLP